MRSKCQRGGARYQKTQRGGALLTVLWLSAGLAAIAFSAATTVRSETDRVSTSADGLRAHYLAEGAVERAILWLNWGYGGNVSVNPATAVAGGAGLPRFWKFNQSRLSMAFPSGDATVDVIPETAKFNINSISAEDLYRVVLSVAGDSNLAHQIADAMVARRTFSATASAPVPSFSVPATSLPGTGLFQETEELLQVSGVTPELFFGNYRADEQGRLYARGGLRDCLSVWGAQGPFDVNTASPALMEAIGTQSDVVNSIVARRQKQPFASIQEVKDILGNVPLNRLTLGGGYSLYTLRATARLRKPDGTYSEVLRTAGATVKLLDQRKQQQPPVVLRWYDDAWSQAVVPPFPGMLVTGGNGVGQPGFSGAQLQQPGVAP